MLSLGDSPDEPHPQATAVLPSNTEQRKSGALLLELQPRGRRDLHPDLRATVESLVANQEGRTQLLILR
jgi:hypothetical protein